jgi:hypothetical protein
MSRPIVPQDFSVLDIAEAMDRRDQPLPNLPDLDKPLPSLPRPPSVPSTPGKSTPEHLLTAILSWMPWLPICVWDGGVVSNKNVLDMGCHDL